MTVNLDEDLVQADWLRGRSWDLPTDPIGFFQSICAPGESSSEALQRFMKLPVARAMPQSLKDQLSKRQFKDMGPGITGGGSFNPNGGVNSFGSGPTDAVPSVVAGLEQPRKRKRKNDEDDDEEGSDQ